jgi:hypothetical protein
MRIDPDTCRDPDLLAAEVRRLKAVIAAGELTLTDWEREAIEAADAYMSAAGCHNTNVQKTLRGLLERTNHDAVPEARAESDEARTDKAATSHRREGTGNTPSEAEIDALEFVVEEGRTASVDDYGILRSWLIRLRPEWESQSYEESDEKRANTTTHRRIDRAAYEGDIVSRLKHWRGLHLAHSGELFEEAAAEIASLREAIRHLAEQDATLSVQDGSVTVTLDATLTDEEREAIAWFAEVRKPLTRLTQSHNREKYKDTLRKLLERLA